MVEGSYPNLEEPPKSLRDGGLCVLYGMDPVDVVGRNSADHRRVVSENGRLLKVVRSYIQICRLNCQMAPSSSNFMNLICYE